MTLKEKFLPKMYCYLGSGMLTNTYDENVALQNAKECEQIADDYAIEFAEWLRYNCVETDYGWQNHGKQYSDTEILKLFKEERGYDTTTL